MKNLFRITMLKPFYYFLLWILIQCSYVVPLRAQKRSYIQLNGLSKVVDLASQGLYQPTLMDARDGTIAIYDYIKHSLIKYTNGKFTTIASGLGGGPQEFRNPTDLVLDKQKNIWIADPVQARISEWNSRDELVYSISHKDELPAKLAVWGNKFIVKGTGYSKKGAFSIYSKDNLLSKAFGSNIYKTLTQSQFLTEGYTTIDKSGFYYAPLYTGYIFKYDLQGKKIFQVKTVDFVQALKEEKVQTSLPGMDNVQISRPPKNAKPATSDIASDGKYIYVLYLGNSINVQKYIDIYNHNNGAYYKSIKVKYGTVAFAINQHKLYQIIYDPSAKNYKLSIKRLPPNV